MEILDRLGINGPWLLSQIVNFTLLLILLRIFAYRPILNMLEQRKRRIQESLEEAERVKQQATAQEAQFQKRLEDERRKAQETMARANQAADKAREEIVAAAKEEAQRIIAEARGQIEYERRQARAEIKEKIAELSLLAAGQVMGRSLDGKTHRTLIAEFLKELDKAE